jgi:regulation of enolase protein 1 (concanavalin A-like superfamily)
VTSGKAGSTFDLTTTPGSLTITSPGNTDLGGSTNDAPKILQPVNDDFVAITKVTGNFAVSGSHAGLLVYIDDQHFMRLERRDGQKIQLGGKDGGAFIYGQYTLSSAFNPTYLKLEKTGTTIKGSWSEDGVNWNLLSWAEPFNGAGQVKVGLFVISQATVTFPAAFEYFTIIPGVVFILPEYPLGVIGAVAAAFVGFVAYKRLGKKQVMLLS